MPYEPKIRLTKGNSYRVTIPIDVIEELQWKKGDILRLSLEKGRMNVLTWLRKGREHDLRHILWLLRSKDDNSNLQRNF